MVIFSASLITGAAWKESFTVRIDEASNVSHILSLLFNASISKDMMKFLKTRCPGNSCPPKLFKFDFGRSRLSEDYELRVLQLCKQIRKCLEIIEGEAPRQ